MTQKKHDFGKIDFMKISPIMGGISFVLVVLSLILIFTKGFNYGIDFAGGTEIQVKFAGAVDPDAVRKVTMDLGYLNAQVQKFGESNEYLIRIQEIKGKDDNETQTMINTMVSKLTTGLKESFKDQNAEIRRVDSVGPAVGEQLKASSVLAMLYSLIMILVYVGLRFEYKAGIASVLCLFHDAVLTLGVFSLLGKEVNVQTLAAVLTLIGYSLNDTIINFDRMRENTGIFRDEDLRFIINKSVNDMLGRTILTSLATFIAVACLWVWGGEVIENLAFTLGIGIVFGVYSTIYVAAPLVFVMSKYEKKRAIARLSTAKA